jgi:hypothetical protein
MNYRRWGSTFVVWLLAIGCCARLLAQEPPVTDNAVEVEPNPDEQASGGREPPGDSAPTDVEPNAEPAEQAPAEQAPIKEKTIYIPYTKLREVFEREGRGVFLPYAEFQQLWKAARDRTTPPVPERPPVPALITEVENEAVVSRDVVRVQAVVKIEVLSKGWHRIALGLGDAAVTSARIGDQPARVVFEPATGYQLLYENKTRRNRSTSIWRSTTPKQLPKHLGKTAWRSIRPRRPSADGDCACRRPA